MTDSMKGKVCIVTGANSGIGRATAAGIAKNGATLVMLCRDNACGEEALNDIVSLSGNDSIELLMADLASQNSIRQFVKDFKQKYENELNLIQDLNKIIDISDFKDTKEIIEKNFKAYF